MAQAASPHAVADLLKRHKAQLMSNWRAMLRELPGSRGLDRPTLDDHIPLLIDEIVAALRAVHEQSVVGQDMEAPAVHGEQRFGAGFDLLEVVAEFNMLRDCLQALVESNDLVLTGRTARVVHHAVDAGLGGAIEAYQSLQDLAVKQRRQEHLAFVAHDLRTPLAVIITAVDILELDEGDRRKTLSVLRDSAYRLNDLVSDVLKEEANLAQESGIAVLRTRTPVRPLVQRVLDDAAPVSQRDGTLLTNQVPDDLVASMDTALIARVLQNLIANALRFAAGRSVAVRARQTEHGDITIEVADTGVGIAADRISHVFGKGHTASTQSGTGYGLASARQYVEAHGGRIGVASVEGNGTTFSF